MFNFDGQMVAGVISDQLAARTFIDILESRRDDRREAGPTEQHYCNLLNAYNQLVARFNRLIDENKKIDALYDETLAARNAEAAEKDQRIAALESDNAELRQALKLANKSEDSGWNLFYKANQKLRDAGLEAVQI